MDKVCVGYYYFIYVGLCCCGFYRSVSGPLRLRGNNHTPANLIVSTASERGRKAASYSQDRVCVVVTTTACTWFSASTISQSLKWRYYCTSNAAASCVVHILLLAVRRLIRCKHLCCCAVRHKCWWLCTAWAGDFGTQVVCSEYQKPKQRQCP